MNAKAAVIPGVHARKNAPDAPASAHARETWPDALRGIGVFFVVLVHIRFFASASLGGVPQWAMTFKAGAAPFYLPALFAVSGYFVPLSLRRGRLRFAWRKLLTIGWPLLLWNFINTARGMDITSLADILRISYLWFLLYLLIYSLVAALLVGRVPAWLLWAITMVLPVFLRGPAFLDLDRCYAFAPYFFAGIVASKWRGQIVRWAMRPAAALLVIAGIGTCWYSSLPGIVRAPLIQVLSLMAIAGGAVLSVWLSQLAGGKVALPLVWLGQHSLEIYVLHWQIGLLMAPLWPHFHSAPLAFVLIGSVVLALAGVAAWLFKLPGLRWAFSLLHAPKVTT